MKRKRMFGMGAVLFVLVMLVSSATAVQIKNYEAAATLENNTKKKVIETLGEFDIKSLLETLYENQDFKSRIAIAEQNIKYKISKTFSKEKRPLVEDFLNIKETFSFDSIADRIDNVNPDFNQLEYEIQDKLEVADDLDELKSKYKDDIGLLLQILFKGDGKPDPGSEGLHEVVDLVCGQISSIYKISIEILEPLLGAVGKVLAVVIYIDILLIILFPVIIPMILYEACADALENEPDLIDELMDIYDNYGFDGFIVYGSLVMLECIIEEGYLQQALREIGKKILLIDYILNEDGSVNKLKFGEREPGTEPIPKPRKRYGTTFEFILKINDLDGVDGESRDKVQAGIDWDNDDVVDEWTELSPNRMIEVSHTFKKSGTHQVKYISKDQWGVVGEWSDPVEFEVPKSRSKSVDIFRFFNLEKFPMLVKLFQVKYTLL